MIAHSGRAENVSVGIVGGGIGGLTAALSLLHRGFDVHVYEQAPMLIEVGAGVQVSPNASRVLHGLGLAAELARTGVKPLAWHQRRWDDGRTLLRSPLAEPLEAAFGSPHYQMHRADLLSALAAGVPAGRLHHRHCLFAVRGRQLRVRVRPRLPLEEFMAEGERADPSHRLSSRTSHSRPYVVSES